VVKCPATSERSEGAFLFYHICSSNIQPKIIEADALAFFIILKVILYRLVYIHNFKEMN